MTDAGKAFERLKGSLQALLYQGLSPLISIGKVLAAGLAEVISAISKSKVAVTIVMGAVSVAVVSATWRIWALTRSLYQLAIAATAAKVANGGAAAAAAPGLVSRIAGRLGGLAANPIPGLGFMAGAAGTVAVTSIVSVVISALAGFGIGLILRKFLYSWVESRVDLFNSKSKTFDKLIKEANESVEWQKRRHWEGLIKRANSGDAQETVRYITQSAELMRSHGRPEEEVLRMLKDATEDVRLISESKFAKEEAANTVNEQNLFQSKELYDAVRGGLSDAIKGSSEEARRQRDAAHEKNRQLLLQSLESDSMHKSKGSETRYIPMPMEFSSMY
jgi:hypothetical protein